MTDRICRFLADRHEIDGHHVPHLGTVGPGVAGGVLGALARSSRSPQRTTGWSSTIRMRLAFMIILGILQEKTRGNLDAREAALLEGALYDLRMKYVERANR